MIFYIYLKHINPNQRQRVIPRNCYRSSNPGPLSGSEDIIAYYYARHVTSFPEKIISCAVKKSYSAVKLVQLLKPLIMKVK